MLDIAVPPHAARLPASSFEWSRGRSRSAPEVVAVLDRVRGAPTILEAMHMGPSVVLVTDKALSEGWTAGQVLAPLLDAVRDDADTVTAIAAIHALGRVPGPAAESILAELIATGVPGYEDHAIWSMYERAPAPGLTTLLVRNVVHGRLSGMHAQRVLRHWGATHPETVLSALADVLKEVEMVEARRHLVETMGLVSGLPAHHSLERIATDHGEAVGVRATAIAAFAERTDERLPTSIGRLAAGSGRIADTVRLVRAQRRLSRRGTHHDHDGRAGLRLVQIHLGAVLDKDVSRAGMGDTGGVATLLSRLGVALAEQPRVAEVMTIGRSMHGDGRAASVREAHRFEDVPLEDGEGATFTDTWPSLVAAERGIRSVLLGAGVPDVIHLRMADPGTLAAATVARELGVATVFTLAPDPHGPIEAAERTQGLDRHSFAGQDASKALWFRADLVRRLGRDTDELVLFPRPQLHRRLRALIGEDVLAGPPRSTVVPEGIDTRRTDAATELITGVDGAHAPEVIGALERAVRGLPVERHGLPVVVSVGRLHEIKGMARTVEAFAVDADLAAEANLVIVGGDLEEPNVAEAAELARIKRLFDRHPGLDQRVILLGHRTNDDVSLILACAHLGCGELIGPAGAYACSSFKEEFGLAIVEAMAAGLPVVVPRAGGPATYVEDTVTGMIVDTTDPAAIAAGSRRALRLARDPATKVRARNVVDERFTLDRMARTLAAVYRVAAGPRSLAAAVNPEAAA